MIKEYFEIVESIPLHDAYEIDTLTIKSHGDNIDSFIFHRSKHFNSTEIGSHDSTKYLNIDGTKVKVLLFVVNSIESDITKDEFNSKLSTSKSKRSNLTKGSKTRNLKSSDIKFGDSFIFCFFDKEKNILYISNMYSREYVIDNYFNNNEKVITDSGSCFYIHDILHENAIIAVKPGKSNNTSNRIKQQQKETTYLIDNIINVWFKNKSIPFELESKIKKSSYGYSVINELHIKKILPVDDFGDGSTETYDVCMKGSMIRILRRYLSSLEEGTDYKILNGRELIFINE